MSGEQRRARYGGSSTSLDNVSTAEGFLELAVSALTECGLVKPAKGEAIVVLCDSSGGWASLVHAAQDFLSAEERARASRFRFERDRNTYIISHALWRVALGMCLQIDVGKVPLQYAIAGQPQLTGTELSTSLSHSGCWIGIAIGAGATVGVDIECSPSRITLGGMMQCICTPAESALSMQQPAADRESSLLALWTRKEALLKAFGVGLDVDLSLFSATAAHPVSPPSAATIRTRCRVFQLDTPAGLVGALALPEAAWSVRLGVMQHAS